MIRTIRNLPSLTAARAFEAAARLGSFTLAAAELGTTQSSVSRHIQTLERQLGRILFLRHNRRIDLTPAGNELATAMTEAFDTMARAFARARQRSRSAIHLTAAPSLSAGWLVPRLSAFQARYPEIEVRLDQTRAELDLVLADFDVALRTGEGQWRGLKAHKLMPLRLTPLCSPALLERFNGAISLQDLPRLPILKPDDPVWPIWCEAAGRQRFDFEPRSGLQLESRELYGHAALAGRGLALLNPDIYSRELFDGQLVQPFATIVDLEPRAYWFVYPLSRARSRPIRLLLDWLRSPVRG